MSISYVFVNNYLKVYGDAAIAGMGIANKVVSLVTLLLVGFVGGAIYSKLWVRVLKVWFLPLGDKELSLFQLYT